MNIYGTGLSMLTSSYFACGKKVLNPGARKGSLGKGLWLFEWTAHDQTLSRDEAQFGDCVHLVIEKVRDNLHCRTSGDVAH